MHELIERLGEAQFISTLDLMKVYWQVALTPSALPKIVWSSIVSVPSSLHQLQVELAEQWYAVVEREALTTK